MEDAELVLKELRIDWETVLTEEYNPLKQALEIKRNSLKLSNYRNIYHKVERIMEKIIEETYKGFSDSVLSYTECYNLTTKGLKDLNQMQKIVESTSSMNINTKDIYGNYQETEYLRIKNEICEDLVNLKEKYESFKSFYKENKIQEAVHDLQEVRDIIKNKNLYNIKGIDTFGLEVEGDVREVCEEIFSKLDLFIYNNEIEFKDYFRLIIVLNRILKYDRFVYANLEKNIFRSIEEIIHGINKKGSEYDDGSSECEGDNYCKDGDDGLDKVNKDNTTQDNTTQDNTTQDSTTFNDNNQLPLLIDGTKIIFTLKSQGKISCFYNGKPKFKSNRNLKSLLVKLIVNKIKMIKYNLNFLRQMTDNAFSQLDDEEKNYYAEYKGFMIFCDKGSENLNLIIQKVINTFIDVYTVSDKKDIEIG
ncbi:WD-repeat protein [Nosema bombycis CQ1]|uniref:WD-repeat protein n=1 Tax=Nosema bombycis (strain CQ1 / CVCC 102059) TaxID=578461 RepID=R0MIN9_NOSB1|nr:WD-repeat protein [Nosema bombycis CQ1]|eukprot:EOB14040.1 WD-repeat protein [Nosema bombycis CQ1]